MRDKTEHFNGLKTKIKGIVPKIPDAVFQEGFDRSKAEKYLKKHPDTPFVLRESAQEGYFCITYFFSNSKASSNVLVKYPTSDQEEFTFWEQSQTGMRQINKSLEVIVQARCFEKVKENLLRIIPEASGEVFHLDYDRTTAEKFLTDNPSIPFVVRQASQQGYFCLTYFSSDSTPSKNVLIPYSLKGRGNHFLEKVLKDHLPNFVGYQRWEQFKKDNESAPDLRAVLSLQSLDMEKAAFTPDQVESYIETNAENVTNPGDGHTGLAIASALQTAPFVVVRSQGNRTEASRVLSRHIGNNGLLVITGHSSPDTEEISGNYVTDEFSEQISRGPAEIVSFAKEAGLKKGSHITIVLSICYGAKSEGSTDSSFAHKLAKEFAKSGISTTIIASDKAVMRFGTGAIREQQIEFSNKVGMDPDSVNVLFTDVDPTTSKSTTLVYKPNEAIQVTANGLVFRSPVVQIKSQQASETVTINKQASTGSPSSQTQSQVAAASAPVKNSTEQEQVRFFTPKKSAQTDENSPTPSADPDLTNTKR
ncbi:hypothetical protein [Legionella waltersii]|uniref:Uncharacterized protein n=1 Tax=Legionella waltersii TaxID=66969 RepID=A0A0W1ANX9_9GAMM|nr:hypothetical protein [Legionella waltersii]KTD83036.1 hypothetical protein Lwal_0152 [Legionella waltersii]SNV07796.1 Uncharacterised protein [Legionella waltersii]